MLIQMEIDPRRDNGSASVGVRLTPGRSFFPQDYLEHYDDFPASSDFLFKETGPHHNYEGTTMNIDGKHENGRVIMTVEGRMDAVSAPAFDKKCEEWIAADAVVFVLDFGGLEYISSAGLRSLLVLGKKLSAKKGKVVIASLKDVVREVFTISGFGTIFTIVESVDAALRQL